MGLRRVLAGATAGSPARLALLLAAAAALTRLVYFAFTGVTLEDSLISLRYAENLASGAGLVYNPGERVFGASTPLYVLFLAALVRLELPALAIARGAAALAEGAVVFLWCRLLLRRTGEPAPAALFALLFGLSPLVVHVSLSGMETAFTLLFLSLALVADLEDRPRLCGAALGALMLLRPEGLLVAGVVLGLRWQRAGKPPWVAALLAFCCVLPWLAGATWYYGTPIPNSIPAKAAAYNLHRPSFVPNLVDTLAQLAPLRTPAPRLLVNAFLLPCWLLGLAAAWREPRFRPAALLFLLWWAYLVLPKTLLFLWYYPPLMLRACVLAALGYARGRERGRRPFRSAWLPAAVGVALVWWLGWSAWMASRVQAAEAGVRREIGLWLRARTPEDARVALEPIGYIGYYSRRRILDEVGLVSPEMIPLNRDGAGWFPRMLREFRPDYVVERPGFLLRNLTLNSRVPIFRTPADREAFLAEYEPLASFGTSAVPDRLLQDYRFVIYGRRSEVSRREWRMRREGMSAAQAEDLFLRTLTGPTPEEPAGVPAPPPRR